MGSRLFHDKNGCLVLDGEPLQDGDAIEVWVQGTWRKSRVCQSGPNWLIVLADGRVSGGMGLSARRLAQLPKSNPVFAIHYAAGG